MHSRTLELKDQGKVSATTRGDIGGFFFEGAFPPFIWWAF